MPTAIVTAVTALHLGLGFAGALIALGLVVRWDYRRICQRTEAKRPSVEVEEFADPWASLPPKWRPPIAESHLGKEHVGERRRAA